MTITIKDETFSGKVLQEINLEFATDFVTVQDILGSLKQNIDV